MSTNSILATAPLATTGFHLKATGTTIGNSLIWDNGTNVGIGNTNTSYTLDVSGTGRFTGALSGTSASFSELKINSTGTEMLNINVVDNSSRQGIRLNNGINSSSGFVLFNSASSTGTTSGGLFIVDQGSASLVQPAAVIVQSGSGDILQLKGSGGAQRLTIDSTGAATFSSSVQTGGDVSIINTGGNALLQQNGSAAATIGMIMKQGGTEVGRITFPATTSMTFAVGSSVTTALTLASTGAATFSSLGTGAVTATGGTLSTTSDMNLKIEDGFIDNALDKILKLTPRYFLWKEESGLPTDLRQLGFYAQEVNEALGEEVANTPKNENENWGIYDRGIIAMLTKAMQEQNQTIQNLQEQINILAK